MVSGDQGVVDSYSASAVTLLRRAAGKGYDNMIRLKTHADLNALRAREDFKKLLQELDERPGRSHDEQQKPGKSRP
jgi:hypothetical protein